MKYFIVILLMFNVACALQGKDGVNGKDGSNGSQGQQGNDGLQGPQGSVGPQGNAGPKGDTGTPGQDGASGVTVVLLCPSVAGAYPELLFRINGKLYGVYYDSSGAHEVEVTPGSYRTTDGRNCTFTVDANLNVS